MKKVVLIFILTLSISVIAQTKVGTIDVDLILSKMPGLAKVQTEIEAYGKQMDADFTKKLTAYNEQVEAYKEGEAGFTIMQKEAKQKEILAAEDELNNFQQNGTKLINLKRDELLQPLYEKIRIALDKVAAAEGYTQVLQLNSTIVYIVEDFDITKAVLAEMGLPRE